MITQSQQQRSYPALNTARADYERQMAAMVGAQSRIDSLEARMRDRRAIAMFPSVVVAKHVSLGDVVQPGQPLVDLADVNQLDVRIEVPTRLVGQLKLGDTVPSPTAMSRCRPRWRRSFLPPTRCSEPSR
jgi:multidrug efflux pump subunit AcrA (membrane-fusion protein)